MAWRMDPLQSLPSAALAQVEGVVDSTNVEEFFTFLNRAFKEGRKAIILDLSGLSYISSGGLSVIVDAYKKAVKAGGTLVILGVPDLIMESFVAVGLDRVLPFAGTREEAIRWVEESMATGEG